MSIILNHFFFIFSYCTAAVAPRLVPPLKRPRLMVAQTRPATVIQNTVLQQTSPNKTQVPISINGNGTHNGTVPEELKTYSKYLVEVEKDKDFTKISWYPVLLPK